MKSVVQYFQETYGFIIQHTYLPCLQVGNQQRANYLPMEVSKLLANEGGSLFIGFILFSKKYAEVESLSLCFWLIKSIGVQNSGGTAVHQEAE